MAAWSNLRFLGKKATQCGAVFQKNAIQSVQIRNMSHGPQVFRVEPTRWQWHKTKDLFHFYTALGVIPLSIVTFLTYVFVGPAQLQEIPEGYIPKFWEYHRNPITRFFLRTFSQSHQELYERTMHYMYEETRKAEITKLQYKVEDLIKKRRDYQEFYYIPYNAEPIYEAREFHNQMVAPLHDFTEEDIAKVKLEAEARKSKSS